LDEDNIMGSTPHFDLTRTSVEQLPAFLAPFPELYYRASSWSGRTRVELFELSRHPGGPVIGTINIDEPFDHAVWDGDRMAPLAVAVHWALAIHSGAALGEDANGVQFCVHLASGCTKEWLAGELREIASRFRPDGSYDWPSAAR
jgi:hypothetical protein